MSGSAFVGSPPASSRDASIEKGIKKSAGTLFFQDPEHPYNTPKPYPDAPDTYDGYKMVAALSVLLVAVITIHSGRFGMRLYRRVSPGLDDGFALLSAMVALAFLSLLCWIYSDHSQTCYGHHTYYCTYEQMNTSVQELYSVQTIFYPGVYFSKLSILFLNRRITAFTKGWWVAAFWAMLALLIVLGLFSFLGTLMGCLPVAAHFSLAKSGEASSSSLHCLAPKVQAQIQNAARGLHIASDLLLLSIPLLVVWKVQMALRMKIMIAMLFGFGIVTVIASIMRIVLLEGRVYPDSPFDLYPPFIWDAIDISFSSMVSSLPVWAGIIDLTLRHASTAARRVSDKLSYSLSGSRRAPPHHPPSAPTTPGTSFTKTFLRVGARSARSTASHERLHDEVERDAPPTPLVLGVAGKTRSTAQGGGGVRAEGKNPPEGQAIARWDEIELSQVSIKHGHEMV